MKNITQNKQQDEAEVRAQLDDLAFAFKNSPVKKQDAVVTKLCAYTAKVENAEI